MYTFPQFVAKFPPIPMPVTLGEDTHHAFSTENEPLPEEMIAQFIVPAGHDADLDEFTEFIPCFAIDDTQHFIALVWWKAGLLNYQYVLATFSDKGQLISRKVIAETKVTDGKVLRSVASINEDWEIFIAMGESVDGNMLFDPTSSKTFDLEIMSNGEIV
jgi:hypothetical protein